MVKVLLVGLLKLQLFTTPELQSHLSTKILLRAKPVVSATLPTFLTTPHSLIKQYADVPRITVPVCYHLLSTASPLFATPTVMMCTDNVALACTAYTQVTISSIHTRACAHCASICTLCQ
jgi:hypothetical protein